MRAAVHTVVRDIVLVGGGHSHVGVVRSFGMRPLPGVRITLVCNGVCTPYSGMLPGYVAGHYRHDEVHIDLARLAMFAQARFIEAEVAGIDRAAQKVVLRGRPALHYDLLSINIGATPQLDNVVGARGHVLPVKPIFEFNQRWLALLQRVQQHQGALCIAMVGGGAGGVELALAMQYRLQKELHATGRGPAALVFHLFTADATILPTHNRQVQQHFMRVLRDRGVQLHCNAPVQQVDAGRLRTLDGAWLQADEIIWVTRAGGAAWLRGTGLALDKDGFIQVDAHLQSVSDTRIFAAGDVASMQSQPLEKAGVFAVRMARPLAENLRRALRGVALLPYRPQRRWLALISTGDRYAVASRGALYAHGALVWRWKDWIDRRFMRRFQEFPAMGDARPAVDAVSANVPLTQAEASQALSVLAMRCGGCGAKVGGDILSRVLSGLSPLRRDDVLIGLDAPDDAAVIRVPAGKVVVHTVDFFRAFIDDPYVFGRIAANHALGDIFAMGAEPQYATAIATVPPGLDRQVEELLLQMMTGAVEVLNAAGCALVGGHTGEGAELALGFAINGLVPDDLSGVLRKGGMRAGDALILTKPIGTGTLFAAHAQNKAQGPWIHAALQSMQLSSAEASRCLREHGATACTDVTGFGLLGHLVEMTRPSGVDARLRLSSVPLLDGALACAASGVLSSLHGANQRMRNALQNGSQFAQDPRLALLFDPQTAGGLLASVPMERASACVIALRALGYAHAAVIGEVLPRDDALAPVCLSE